MAIVPRVFVVQRSQRWDVRQQKLVDKFDLEPARQHGELVFLLSPSAAPFNSESVVRDLHLGLDSFNPEVDSLLLIGNPCLIGFAVALAGDLSNDGKISLLQWHGKDHKYIRVEAVMFPDFPGP